MCSMGRRPRASLIVCVLCMLGRSVPAQGNDAVSPETEARLADAFAKGLGEFKDGKTPAFLEVEQFGNHWRLTGLDRNGASMERLQCLLCTETEAFAAAAHLGDNIGKRLRDEPPSAPAAPSDAMLSIDGVPIAPPLPAAETERVPSSTSDRSTIRRRWAIASAGLGASAFAVGGVFMWLDGECSSSNCRYTHAGLKGPGIGLVVTGALLETAALLLWLVKRNPKEAPQ